MVIKVEDLSTSGAGFTNGAKLFRSKSDGNIAYYSGAIMLSSAKQTPHPKTPKPILPDNTEELTSRQDLVKNLMNSVRNKVLAERGVPTRMEFNLKGWEKFHSVLPEIFKEILDNFSKTYQERDFEDCMQILREDYYQMTGHNLEFFNSLDVG